MGTGTASVAPFSSPLASAGPPGPLKDQEETALRFLLGLALADEWSACDAAAALRHRVGDDVALRSLNTRVRATASQQRGRTARRAELTLKVAVGLTSTAPADRGPDPTCHECIGLQATPIRRPR